MLVAPSIQRAAIDSWPIKFSGLPARVVNSVSPSNVQTVGDLRNLSDSELMQFRSLGRISLRHIHDFFELCAQIEQGRQCFNALDEILKLFLDEEEYKVLIARYGFASGRTLITRNTVTLQEVGNAEHKTRERIRQIQDVALQKLSSRLATVCLHPFFNYAHRLLDRYAQVIAAEELAPRRNDPVFSTHNPCGVFLLLCDLPESCLFMYRDFFSSVPVCAISLLEESALRYLNAQNRPVGIDELIGQLPPLPELKSIEQTKRVACMVLDHYPNVGSTTDNRFFVYDQGAQPFLLEIMNTLNRPAHYRMVTNAFNDRLKPQSRKGAGYILEQLNVLSQCTRVDRGVYDLKPEL
ncbi:MAG TPA: hypothetical protein DCZ95_02325 [Verrucomicrobia bacterium]|nr:MAG: hypothetical protein A2X46_00520 [Lentisphaerae bacterium GWF2_57_35]HBA82908.1 hypothetical protein [Verrucomicrobiota bacterium]